MWQFPIFGVRSKISGFVNAALAMQGQKTGESVCFWSLIFVGDSYGFQERNHDFDLILFFLDTYSILFIQCICTGVELRDPQPRDVW